MSTFICTVCRGEFEKELTDAEAIDQFKREFPEHNGDTNECDIICHDCYLEFERRVGSDLVVEGGPVIKHPNGLEEQDITIRRDQNDRPLETP